MGIQLHSDEWAPLVEKSAEKGVVQAFKVVQFCQKGVSYTPLIDAPVARMI
jgi:hypothetical protein